jgi:hypothetical protein
VPSQLHEVLVSFFQERPELAPLLLEQSLGVELPAYTEVRVESASLSDALPTEYRADVVVLLSDGRPVLGIVIEVQLLPDPRKRFTWPAYVTSLRSRFECASCLLVVTPSDDTARWAQVPIDTGPCGLFAPFVVGPDGIPVVTDETLARQFPELAVLSVMAHGSDADVVTAVAVAEIAAAAAHGLESDKQALYLDLIETALGDAARKAFQMLPQNYQFQGPSYRLGRTEGRTEGRAEGRAEGEAEAVLVFLEARGIAVTDEQRQRILECDDLERLGVWLRRAATVADASGLFEA